MRMPIPAPRGAMVRLQRDAPGLKAAERRVAEVCIDDPAGVVGMSVQELAAAAGASTATVIRMCQALGFSGYSQFKIVLAAEVTPAGAGVWQDLTRDDTPIEVLEKVFQAETATLADTLTVIDRDEFTRATRAIAAAARIRFLGVGTSGPVAQDASFQFQQFGRDAIALTDAIQMEISSLSLDASAVAVGISHSGATRATVDALERARAQGAKTICVTSYPASPIARTAEIALVVAARETSYRSGASAGRLAHLTVLDALNVAVANRDPELRVEMHQQAAAVVARHSV